MLHGIIKAYGKVVIEDESGKKQTVDYLKLRDSVIEGKVEIDNMYLNDDNELFFIKENTNNKYNLPERYNSEAQHRDNRRAGWHSGGDKKPYGFTHK